VSYGKLETNHMPNLPRSLTLVAVVLLANCGGSDGDAPAGNADAGTDSAGGPPSLEARKNAAAQSVADNALCKRLPAFYWEIGDVSGPLASGAVGAKFTAQTPMAIASASKFVFGAYVVERFKGDLSKLDASAMRMLSGYTSLDYNSCLGSKSVSACLGAASNSTHTAANVDHFFYNGGHFQKYAVDLGLGNDDNAALAAHIKEQVGPDLSFTYGSPQLAAGITTSPTDYAVFLRKILAGTLAIKDHLGEQPVCTLPSSCPTAKYSPAAAAWHYSYGHWVEDDPATGDGAFSSPGAYGFYPWIDASKTYYGIVARFALTAQAYLESAECGVVVRKAFLTGTAQ